MAAIAVKVLQEVPAQVPEARFDLAFDRAHLVRVTFGDRSLERELLQLFDRQSALLTERMQGGDSAAVGALAHTLKGSAAGIGASGVAQAAVAVERATSESERSAAIDHLTHAVAAAREAIAQMLAA